MAYAPNAARRSESSRRAILAATAELCAECGYGRLTIEAIAARAGVSKKTIYRWWPSIGAVVVELIDETADEVATHPDTGDLFTDLRTQLGNVIAMLSPPETSLFAGLIAAAQSDPQLAGELRDRLIQPRIEEFHRRIRSAKALGQLPADADPAIALDLLYGPIYHRLAFHLGMPEGEYLDSLIRHALRALGG